MVFKKKIDRRWVFADMQKPNERKEAQVPGCIHLDLLRHGIIDNPYFRDNEVYQQWISGKDWLYSCVFDLFPSEINCCTHYCLNCEGLDTLANIHLNGHVVGHADNMHRNWEFDISDLLVIGENRLEILFKSPVKACEEKYKRFKLNSNRYSPFSPDGKSHLRKEMANFGWDWGPCLVTSGIWRDIYVIGWNGARLEEPIIVQRHLNGRVQVKVTPEYTGDVDGLNICAGLSYGDLCLHSTAAAGKEITFDVDSPALWWPHDLGEQNLYKLELRLCDENRQVIDTVEKMIGLRTVELVREQDEWGESFYFKVNGRDFFAKGANWIPPDTFAARVDSKWRERLLLDALDANMNMIRVWGGGVYEANDFYDCCDRLGLLVWQDFMFACAAYPADDEFLENVRSEIKDNVKRLRHHPCLALWCGNNELEQRLYKPGIDWPELPPREYERIFDRMIPAILKELTDDVSYWPCSPHSPVGARSDYNNQNCGDTHLWNVWHLSEPFEWYEQSKPRFCSEFGFQSFPAIKTINDFTLPEDRFINSRVMEYHQRSRIGNKAIIQYMADWLPLNGDFEAMVIASQMLQGISLKCAISQWRRNMPRCMGALYWQLNDCWPGPSWSTIDWSGKFKASYYFVKRAFAPEMVSIVADRKNKGFVIHVCNDKPEPLIGSLTYSLTDVKGRIIQVDECKVNVPGASAVECKRIDAVDDSGELICWCRLSQGGNELSHDFSSFANPKHLSVVEPELSMLLEGSGCFFELELKSMTNAFWIGLDLGGVDFRSSDNFFSMRAGEMKKIFFKLSEAMSEEEFMAKMSICSLYDLFYHDSSANPVRERAKQVL